MFEPKTQTEILTIMKNYYTDIVGGKLSTEEGTFVGDNLSAVSVEFEKAYAEMSLIIEAAFATTSWGEYLTMRAREFGVNRKLAVKAIGMVTVTGTGIVTQGSLFATADGTMFAATKAVRITDSGDVPIEAIVSGKSGNVAAGTITKIPISIAGITSVTNTAKTTDGYDEETDTSLLARFLQHVQRPITSGNANQYKDWALSVAGVGACQVLPLWNGNGTVKVLIVDTDKNTASSVLIKSVQDYIDSVKPVGATVTVATPSYMYLTVAAKVKVNINYTDNYSDVLKNTIGNYLIDSGFTNSYVSLAQIGKAMLDSGAISDYDKLTLNGGTANITLTAEQLPRIGDLAVTLIE